MHQIRKTLKESYYKLFSKVTIIPHNRNISFDKVIKLTHWP